MGETEKRLEENKKNKKGQRMKMASEKILLCKMVQFYLVLLLCTLFLVMDNEINNM